MNYPEYPIPPDEALRQRELESSGLLDSGGDEHFDRLVRLASTVMETPTALISLVDGERQWFLARHGLEAQQTPRHMAFCAHAITDAAPLVVPDARLDPRFCTNPLVTGAPHIRFYAGAQLQSDDGHNLGTLCVIDRLPRRMSNAQVALLQDLAQLVRRELELRRQAHLCPVTGLLQRPHFLKLAQRSLERARTDGDPMAMVVLGIGHCSLERSGPDASQGDRLLAALARRSRDSIGARDLIGRLGSHEFGLMLSLDGGQQAEERVDTLTRAISPAEGLILEGLAEPVSIRSGLSLPEEGDRSVEDAFLRASKGLL